MKNKIAIASAFLAASSFSMGEIAVNDFLALEGFVDMSYQYLDTDHPDSNANSFGVDQVEIDWLFDFDPVTAQIDLEYEDDADQGNQIEVEQAYATYSLSNGGAVTAGRYASMLGFEAFEPTGLYQYSFAYDFFDSIDIGTPLYNQGVKYTYETDTTFFGASLQDSGVSDNYDDNFGGPNGGWGLEVAGAYMPGDGLTYFLGTAFEDGDLGSDYVINGYVSYETGAWVFGAELNYANFDNDAPSSDIDGFSGLVMANYAYSDVASVTGRISFYDEDDDGNGDADGVAFTVAHGYAFTDSLLLVTEITYAEEDDASASGDTEKLFGAVELLFTF